MPTSRHDIRKAAILVGHLDRQGAEALLDQLPRAMAVEVRQAIVDLGPVEPDELHAVLSEFHASTAPEQPAPSGGLPELPGIELEGMLAEQISTAPTATPEPAPLHAPQAMACERFQFLHDADDDAIAKLIAGEHPQTIAVVAAHLDHQHACRVLLRLPQMLQADVLRRLANLDESDPESLLEVERELEAKLRQETHYHSRRQAGLSAVSEILKAAEPEGRRILLSSLRRRDNLLAEKLTGLAPVTPEPSAPAPREPVRFEELARWSDHDLATVLREAHPELVVLAMAEAGEMFAARAARLAPPATATALAQGFALLGPIRLSDISDAQHQIARLAQHLRNQGQTESTPSRLSVAA